LLDALVKLILVNAAILGMNELIAATIYSTLPPKLMRIKLEFSGTRNTL
jgi:hypothetical protein